MSLEHRNFLSLYKIITLHAFIKTRKKLHRYISNPKKKKIDFEFLNFFFLHFSRVTIVLLRWITMVVLKDLDTKIKHRLKKLRMQVAVSKTKRDDKTHQD